MRFILYAVSAMAFLSTAGAVSAQTITDPQWTVSGGCAHVESTNAAYSALTARAAAKLHKNFGVEAEGSFGITEDIAQGIIFPDDLKLKYDLAGYAVGYLPVTENFELFGRLGYGTTQVSAEHRGKKIATRPYGNGESINYGVGANWYFTESSGVRIDYTRRDNVDTKINTDVYSLSYTHRF